MTERPRTEQLGFLQALRGLAAMSVVFYHFRPYLGGAPYDLGDRLFASGSAGVDLFFVISGFIMVHTTADRAATQGNALRFLIKRFARIWPVYVIVTLAFLVLATDPVDTVFGRAIAVGKAFVFYPQSAHGAPFFSWAPLAVGWTLNYEMWFYLLFTASLCAGRGRWPVLFGLFACFGVGVPCALAHSVSLSAYHDYGLGSALLALAANSLVWEFLLGVCIGLVYRTRAGIRDFGLSASFVAVSATLVLWQYFSGYRNEHGPLGWGPAMALLVLALALHHKMHGLRPPRWLVWLGDISFSIYLVHLIPQRALPRLLGDDAGTRPLVEGGGFFLGGVALTLVLAYWSHRLLERGLAEWVRDRLLRRSPAELANAAASPPA